LSYISIPLWAFVDSSRVNFTFTFTYIHNVNMSSNTVHRTATILLHTSIQLQRTGNFLLHKWQHTTDRIHDGYPPS